MVGAVRFMLKPPITRRGNVAGSTGPAAAVWELGPLGADSAGVVPTPHWFPYVP